MCWPWLPKAVPGLRQRHLDNQYHWAHTDYHENTSNVSEDLMARELLSRWATWLEPYQRKDN